MFRWEEEAVLDFLVCEGVSLASDRPSFFQVCLLSSSFQPEYGRSGHFRGLFCKITRSLVIFEGPL